MASDSDLTELFNDLSIAHGFDLDAIKDVLEKHGIIDPSRSLIKKLLANVESKRCCRCHFVAEGHNELVAHLNEEDPEIGKHVYGQGNFAKAKRVFIHRVKISLDDETLPDVDVTSDSPKLTKEEKRAFAGFESDLRLNSALRSTYENLLYIGLCMVFLRKGLTVTPSKKTEAVATKAVIANKSRKIAL